MKRYLLFGYDDFYPQGGPGDFEGDFVSVEAIDVYISLSKYKSQMYAYLDTSTGAWFERQERGNRTEWQPYTRDDE